MLYKIQVSMVPMNPLDQSHNKFITVPSTQYGDLSFKESYNSETNTSEMESSLSLAESVDEVHAWVSAALKPRKILHKRKGIPLRAPFCWYPQAWLMFFCLYFTVFLFILFSHFWSILKSYNNKLKKKTSITIISFLFFWRKSLPSRPHDGI